jgi:hypothetical protein
VQHHGSEELPWQESSLEAVGCGQLCYVGGFLFRNGAVTRYPLIESGSTAGATTFTWEQPIVTKAGLQGLACHDTEPVSNVCTAVGYQETETGAHALFIEHKEEAGEWKLQSASAPTGAISSELNAVSCPRATICFAVGTWENASHVHAGFGLRWTSTGGWVLKSLASPKEAKAAYPTGVSCQFTETEKEECEMVGQYENTAGKTLPFAEHWNGTAWSSQTVPTPTGSSRAVARAVSCTAEPAPVNTVVCTMVGAYRLEEVVGKTLAERWNGAEWKIQATPNAEEDTNELDGVSCVSKIECIAVGEFEGPKVPVGEAQIWNGTEWKFQKTASTTDHLRAISCKPNGTCISAGNNQVEELFGPYKAGYAEVYH